MKKKHQVYFSVTDMTGASSRNSVNFWNLIYKHNKLGSNGYYGSNSHVKNTFPRGKAYDKLFEIQMGACI